MRTTHHHPHHAPTLAPANTILGQVERQVRNARVRLAMLMAPYLEGGGPTPLGAGGWGTGDNGVSGGGYQINTAAHPGVTLAQTRNPRFAVAYMRPRYAAAARTVPARLWRTNPTLATEETIQRAEIPATSYYNSHGTAAVNMAYRDAVRAATKGGAGVGGTVRGGGGQGFSLPSIPGSPLNPGGLGGILGGAAGGAASSAISGALQPLTTFLTKAIFVTGGAGLVVLGASMTAKRSGVPVTALAAMGA